MLSILTPTFNRAHTLKRLFDSLTLQSDQRFEWVVIDDGSTDGSCQRLKEWAAQSSLTMRVVTQENGGKHVAINAGVMAARGDWVFIVDSDDLLTPDAVSKVYEAITAEEHAVHGLCFRKAYLDRALVGVDISSARGSVSYMHPTEAGHFYQGDLAYIFMLSAMLAEPFPVFTQEKFVPELLVWNRIGDKGRIAYFHHIAIYVCEYLPDGYTANFHSNLRSNPRGFKAFYEQQFFREVSLVHKLKCAIRVIQCLGFCALRSIAK